MICIIGIDLINDRLRYSLSEPTYKAPPALAGNRQETTMNAPIKHPALPNPVPGYYPMILGDMVVTALSDGTIPFALEKLYQNTNADHVASRLTDTWQGTPTPASFNAFLFAIDNRLILVDTGSGDLAGSALGHVERNLMTAGYGPAQICDVILTHLHSDHFGGLIRDGKMAFPNARLHIPKRDADFFLNPDHMALVPAAMHPHFKNAIACIAPYENTGRVSVFADNASPIPDFAMSVLLPGHSPGHSGIIMQSGETAVFCWGDISHGHIVQFEDPAIAICFDVDGDTAVQSRKKALEFAVTKKCHVAGSHIAFPGIGHITVARHGYRWNPTVFQNLP
jgi:glyoxylase-like metal-dependent hydrolase (beta-lactamase superfamily II)